MSKFSYPNDILRKIFDEYYDKILNAPKINKTEIDKFLIESDLGYSLKEFLTLPFDKLIECAKILDLHKSETTLNLNINYAKSLVQMKEDFNYTEILKSSISPFFMKFSSILNIKTCYYCNIDFVNSYIPFKNDYSDFFELVNEGDIDDLSKIIGITKPYAKIIRNKCNGTIKTVRDLEVKLKNHSEILAFLLSAKNSDGGILFENLKNQKNHYTIDHILPQSKFPFFSLCLYNLIPSCYTCNSKLKKSKMLSENYKELAKFSPTSEKYENPLNFKLFYKGLYSIINLPTELEQYDVKLETSDNYPDFFNLQGRYNFHKNESLKLIKQRKIYSDSQIDEISKLLKMDVKEIRKHLFGPSIFEDNTNEPFEKYKKDIAKQLTII